MYSATVELRVREVLEEKLQRILEEFGVDKLADVLDSEEGGVPFESLFAQAILSPEEAESRAIAVAEEIRRRAEEARAGSRLFSGGAHLDPVAAQRIAGHQIPYWTERMTLEHLRCHEDRGAAVRRERLGYTLRWPDGHEIRGAVFARDESERPGAVHLNLEDDRVRGLTAQLPVFAPGQPVPALGIADVSDKIGGLWSLWRVSLQTTTGREQRFFPLFVSDDGRVLGPTARTIWDRLIDLPAGITRDDGDLDGSDAADAYQRCRQAAEAQGASVFDELAASHRESVERERRKGILGFASRKRAIARLGLAQVRAHRLKQLAEEERAWQTELAVREAALPDLAAVMLVRIRKDGASQ